MRNLLLLVGFIYTLSAFGQRNYASKSVLSEGMWFQFSVTESGVYKIDGKTLRKWGATFNTLSSSSLRLYGNGGGMLSEDNNQPWIDDLFENNILIVDGGDGMFNEDDYLLFYAEGPHRWLFNTNEKKYTHQKNLYTNAVYYYLSTGGSSAARINDRIPPGGLPDKIILDFEDRYFYENDNINLLKGGKEWLGEEFAVAPGKTNTYSFPVSFQNRIKGNPIIIRSSVAAKSETNASRFEIEVANPRDITHLIAPVGRDQYDRVANLSQTEAVLTTDKDQLVLKYTFTPGGLGATGWLNWFEVFAKRSLDMRGVNSIQFDHYSENTSGEIAEFRIQNADPSLRIWDISDPLRPVSMPYTISNNTLSFRDMVKGLKRYIAFRLTNMASVTDASNIANQNLHALNDIEYVIVAYPDFLTEAQRLAQWHRDNSLLEVAVVTTTQIYHEFGSGVSDPAAIRDFIKMLYDRGKSPDSKPLKYLLLFGDASYDYQNRISQNTNFVPCYESAESFDPLSSYTSDDFYGLLDDGDNASSNIPYLVDIGIGRIPAKTKEEARAVVDKIFRYHQPESFGSWRNEITLIADDEDQNLHLDDAEFHSNVIVSKLGKIPSKIYLDAFQQQSGSGGSRYPLANVAVNNKILSGTLIWNYSGHGGFRRLAEEVILDNDMVNTWNNTDKLPLFVTATCDFAPYDNPSINSLGESLLLRDRVGAIALMTTTRVVFAFSNRVINNNFFQIALTPNSDGLYPSLGESIMLTKNLTYSRFGDVINNRKFTLLGDPALRLGISENKVRTTFINGKSFNADTLRALSKYEIKGEVTDKDGNRRTNFNGDIYAVIYDKPQTLSTLKNDAGSKLQNFTVQNNIVFKGKSRANAGEFSLNFVVPKDINYSFDKGLISYYGYGAGITAFSNERDIYVGGIGNVAIIDNQGPLIKAYLNDEKFVDGGITNENPLLLLKLFDSSGINSAGAGIGHDISATIDGDFKQYYVLNDFYSAESGSYQRGSLRFQLPPLKEGDHFIDLKVWDVVNNSSSYRINFKVVKDVELSLANVYNYPNPFTTRTKFMFEHNRPGDMLQVQVRIYSVAGNLVKTINQTINSTGNRSFDIEWDGTDNFGRKIGRGVYIYDLNIKDSKGKKRSARQKLVLL